jgi:hypothetical protein
MLEYLILLIFIGIMFYPLQMDMTAKIVELILVFYAAYRSLLIGLFCAIVFAYNLSLSETKSYPLKKVSVYELEERIRPKDSNNTCVPITSYSLEYSPNEPYKAFNVEL